MHQILLWRYLEGTGECLNGSWGIVGSMLKIFFCWKFEQNNAKYITIYSWVHFGALFIIKAWCISTICTWTTATWHIRTGELGEIERARLGENQYKAPDWDYLYCTCNKSLPIGSVPACNKSIQSHTKRCSDVYQGAPKFCIKFILLFSQKIFSMAFKKILFTNWNLEDYLKHARAFSSSSTRTYSCPSSV